jgi:hypothetical protein
METDTDAVLDYETMHWGARGSTELQHIVDTICYDELLGLDFSVTVADPSQPDCPLVACSEGFSELTGYTLTEIIGRNCRFLLNGVPPQYIDESTRMKCRQYVNNSGDAAELEHATAGDEHLPDNMKKQRLSLCKGEMICVQTNARKTGELFKNMFYMKQVDLDEKLFVLGLQARLPEEWETTMASNELEMYCRQTLKHLAKNMSAIESILSRQFWYSAAMRRQSIARTDMWSSLIGCGLGAMFISGKDGTSSESTNDDLEAVVNPKSKWNWQVSKSTAASDDCAQHDDDDDDAWSKQTSASTAPSEEDWHPNCRAPAQLHAAFNPDWVTSWDPGRYEWIEKLENAVSNQGIVGLMREVHTGELVVVKRLPNSWIQSSYKQFNERHPSAPEQPWQDIGCSYFLDSVGYPYSVGLIGVSVDEEHTHILFRLASEGDLFGWASKLSTPPGLEREALIKPLAKQMARSIQGLHELSIVHRDLSLENVLLDALHERDLRVKVIDFGAASTSRNLTDVMGKPSYRAPEMFCEGDHDGFLADAFAFGVILYSLQIGAYPWCSTEGKGDKVVQYVRRHGFRSFIKKQKFPNSHRRIGEFLSEDLVQLLEGLLEFDPSKRLTLGESAWKDGESRKTVWHEPWMA